MPSSQRKSTTKGAGENASAAAASADTLHRCSGTASRIRPCRASMSVVPAIEQRIITPIRRRHLFAIFPPPGFILSRKGAAYPARTRKTDSSIRRCSAQKSVR